MRNIPEFVVLGFHQDDGAGGLHVERGGAVFDGGGDDFVDAGVGDGGGFGQGVAGHAVSNGAEEGGGGWGGGCHLW